MPGHYECIALIHVISNLAVSVNMYG